LGFANKETRSRCSQTKGPRNEAPSSLAARLEIKSEPIQTTIKTPVGQHVAVTSTLPVWEEFVPSCPDAPLRVLDVLSETVRSAYQQERKALRASITQGANRAEGRTFETYARMLQQEMEFEREFVRPGDLLMAGPDAVLGGNIAGFGDQRGVELLVEAGFTPLEAIKIATLNGAQFLKQSDASGPCNPANKQT
jgi:hypothetical protein